MLLADDGNNFTSGLNSIVTIYNLFVNPIDTIITFSSTIVSEFGDIDFQSSSQQLLCFTCNINLLDSANSSCYGANDGLFQFKVLE